METIESTPKTNTLPGEKQSDARTSQANKFSESEWKHVKMKAPEPTIPESELVCGTQICFTSNKTNADFTSIPVVASALIELFYGGVLLFFALK